MTQQGSFRLSLCAHALATSNHFVIDPGSRHARSAKHSVGSSFVSNTPATAFGWPTRQRCPASERWIADAGCCACRDAHAGDAQSYRHAQAASAQHLVALTVDPLPAMAPGMVSGAAPTDRSLAPPASVLDGGPLDAAVRWWKTRKPTARTVQQTPHSTELHVETTVQRRPKTRSAQIPQALTLNNAVVGRSASQSRSYPLLEMAYNISPDAMRS